MATYVIGDIHNNIKGLEDVLTKAPLQPGDTLIPIGDIFDGWKYAKEVAQLLMNLQHQYNCIFIMGNHDEWVLDWLKTGVAKDYWLKQGGQRTYDSLSQWFEDEPQMADELMMFINRFDYKYVDEQNRGFVHGGYHSKLGLGKSKLDPESDHISVYTWDRTLFETAYTRNNLDGSKIPRLDAHTEVYIGHTATTMYGVIEPMIIHNLINIDTGSGGNGCLSIMNIDTKEYWQSKKSKLYYPQDANF